MRVVSSISSLSKRLFVGRPLTSGQLGETLLPIRIALPIFSSDALSSVAYATQEIVLVLSLGGLTYYHYTPFLAAAVVTLMAAVVFSYRRTVHAYPSGGGDYEVAQTNFGERAGVTVAAALLTDYIVTVAVSVAAGVEAITSAAPSLYSSRTVIAVGLVMIITLLTPDLYRYAPWFAAVWIPLTYLPRDAVTAGWIGLMFAAALISTLPLLRRGPAGWAAFAIFAPTQIEGAVFGNVQPLVVLVLLWGVERRAGPLWIALSASLKAVPLLLAIVYAGRGEWRRAALTMGLTALLVAPAFLFDLAGYSTDPGPRQTSLAGVSLLIFIPVAAAAIAATWILARTRFGWLAGGLAMILSLPRFLDYEIGFLLVGLSRRREIDRP